jgi:3-phenylpropionate/trans-cinnamate dioxygenase ferredoxin reductase subunit
MRSIAVVGASLAGLRAAQALRTKGYDGRLTLVGAEPHRPYDRPPLSKNFLAGELDAAELALLDPAEDTALGADWQLGVRATGVDPAAGTVALSDGTELAVDGLVIATGGRPRTLPGTERIDGVLTLRTLDDALALRTRIAAGPTNVVVVGAGFLGAEVSSTLRGLGLAVTVVEALPVPLAGALGPELGALCAELPGDHGVPLITGQSVTGLGTAGSAAGSVVASVRLADGRELAADLVVVAIGIRPNTEWLAGSGLAVDDGVRTDVGFRTALPNVVAVGDVARHHCDGRHVRHEHWTNAADEPAAAVTNLLAGRTIDRCSGRGYFWSDQYGVRIQFAGSISPTDEVRVLEGSTAERAFLAGYHRAGRVTGVLAMNLPRAFNRARRGLTARNTEEDRCPSCSSAEPGGAPRTAADTTSSTPSTRA